MDRHGLNKRTSDSTRNMRIVGIMAACICVCLAFVAGFVLRGDEALLQDLGFSSLIDGGEDNPATALPGSSYNSVSARVAEVESLLQAESLAAFDLGDATTEVLGALTDSTSDEYLRYYTAERYAAYVQENAGKYSGIGALFSEYKGDAYVVDVFPGSVAESAGVEAGDFIVSIDGDRSQDWSLTETVNALSRDSGETAVITWRRPTGIDAAGGEEFTTTLACSEYREPNIVSELHGEVGYIAIKQLTQNSAELTQEAIVTLGDQGAKAFVIDIRDNPGGFLTQAVEIASLFVKSGVVVGLETKGEHTTTKSATGSIATDKPLVVLTNGDTAAAAEVLAAAIKDNSRGTILGQKTLGKGSVQVVKPLSFGGALRYTAAYYKSPLGQDIEGFGIVPDIVVDQISSAEEDNQKNLSIETAQTMIETE